MFKRWQELFWIAVLLVITFAAYRIIPAIDPRSGIDGWGDLFAGLIAAVKGVMVTLLAWMSKRLYWWEPSDETDAWWHEQLSRQPAYSAPDPITGLIALVRPWHHPAFFLIAFDRLELLLWLAFWFIVLF